MLRYNKTTAYIPHLDWIDDPQEKEKHDYITNKKGTNRFATILLYMSDLDDSDGGETVFAKGWPDQPEKDRISKNDALAALRESGEVDFLKRDSWQETMVANCRSRLAVRPHNARAVLFYSQHPNGEEDHASLHGGCPVLSEVNTKWAVSIQCVPCPYYLMFICREKIQYLLIMEIILKCSSYFNLLFYLTKTSKGKSLGLERTESRLSWFSHKPKICG